MHPLPDGWDFNGDLIKPTFAPSFRHSWHKVKDGKRVTVDGEDVIDVCHYIITKGVANFCGDCTTHDLRGPVPMPTIPPELADEGW